jgi:general secretion pathway protein D
MVMTLRNFILIASIVFVSSLSAFAQSIENKQGPSSIAPPASETIDSTASQGIASENQPANLPALLPQEQKSVPFSQETLPPDAKINQPGAFPGQPGTVSPTGPMPVPKGMPGPLAPKQIIPTSKQPTFVPERTMGQQGIKTGQTGKVEPPGPMNQPALSPAVGASTAIGRGAISLNFDDADIYSVIQTVFSEILKLSYIIDPRVKGRVTFRSVAPVPRDNVLPLMEVILRLNGVAVIEDKSLYRIIPISDLAREPSPISIGRSVEKITVKGKALLQVVPIEYLQSTEVAKLLVPFASTSAVIVDVPKTNHIIIVDTDANVKRLLELVNFFDSELQKKKGPQVFVYHIQNSKAKDIGALLQQIFLGAKQTATTSDKGATQAYQADKGTSQMPSATQPSPPSAAQAPKTGTAEGMVSDVAKIFSDEVLNAIIVLGTPEDYRIIKETIIKLDIVPRQVLIEGTIAQVQLTDKMSLGIAWAIKNSAGQGYYLNPGALQFDPTKISTPGLNLVGVDSGGTVTALINALAQESKAKFLATPHIMVSDNREARIQVGQQVPIVTSETFGSTTVAPQRTIQYKDIGIILKVKPQINDSGLVAMQISQEISTFTTEVLYDNSTEIIVNKTEVATNLVVNNGDTIIIGGLIRQDDTKAKQGIPFLSKIPVIGYLFGNTSTDIERVELVILLTPRVIKTKQEAQAVTDKYVGTMSDETVGKKFKEDLKAKTPEQKK